MTVESTIIKLNRIIIPKMKTKMKTKNLKRILLAGTLVLFLITSCNSPKSHGLPGSWFVAGSQPKSYIMTTDNLIAQSGNYSAVIKSSNTKTDGFGTLMQQCSPDKFIGKRVKMSGYLRSDKVVGTAGLWFRVDVDTIPVSFDNMIVGKKNRSISGTTDWRKFELILDVPANATLLSYGALLSGTGQIGFDNLKFEAVDKTVETTGVSFPCAIQNGRKHKGALPEPSNLDFEK